MKLLLLILVLSAFAVDNIYSQNTAIKIPKGKNILIDGKIQKSEWNDSKAIRVSDSVTLYFKADIKYIYIAIQVAEGKSVIADVYCTKGSNMINLHASAKLGQRNFVNEKWEDWNWWNNFLWTANVSRIESFDKKTFLKENLREFQVDKELFAANNTKIFFEVTFLNEDGGTSLVLYPSNGIRNRSDNWVTLKWK